MLKEISPEYSLEGLMLATCCKELTHLKRPWCWERLKAGGKGDDRGWDGWMASVTRWTWVWVGSRSWWWTGRPGVLQSMGSQRFRHDWATGLNWTMCFLTFVFQSPIMKRTSFGGVSSRMSWSSRRSHCLMHFYMISLFLSPRQAVEVVRTDIDQFPWLIYGNTVSVMLLQFSSVAQLCLTLCHTVDYSMAGLPVHHQLLEPTQTHVHWVGDAIQPSLPLSSPSCP